MAADPVIPAPRDDDDDDVAWALQTAAVQWSRGAHTDAVEWLRRAVDAAIATGNYQRTKELNRLSDEVAERIVRGALGEGASGSVEADQVDSGESRVSLTAEIPVDDVIELGDEEFGDEEEEEDDFDDEAPTIPPPPASDRHFSPEHGLSADAELEAPDDVEQNESTDPFARSLLSEEPAEAESSEPGAERVDAFSEPFSDRGTDRAAIDPFARTMPEEPRVPREAEPFPSYEEPQEAELPPPASMRLQPMARSSPRPARPEPREEPVKGSETPSAPPERSSDRPTRDSEGAARRSRRRSRRPLSAPPSGPWGDGPTRSVPPSVLPGQRKSVEPAAPGSPAVDGVALEQVRGFEDLPEEAQFALVSSAEVESLGLEEEVGGFAAALVTAGAVGIMPAIADAAAAIAQVGDVVFTRGTMKEGVELRVVALEDTTRVAVWKDEELDQAMADCPWVSDELKAVADRFQALAGATMGVLGERLDDGLRAVVTDRLEVRVFDEGQLIVEAGKPVAGLYVVGVGWVELADGDVVKERLGPGDFLFAAEVMAAGAATLTARAGESGALMLFASRTVAHELMVSVPPLLEILAG